MLSSSTNQHCFPRLVIAGRPNVGKSTLFNRISARRLAITGDIAGTTRDTKEHLVDIAGKTFIIVDTAGWEDTKTNGLQSLMTAHTKEAITSGDLVLFVVDGKAGIMPDDFLLAKVIRASGKPVLLIVNKSESPPPINQNDLFKLGFGEPVYLSAEHNLGFSELYIELIRLGSDFRVCETVGDEPDAPSVIKLAIIGRPNVGKSTLFNKILGKERSIVSEEAGTTRDAVTYDIQFKSHTISLIDTAGMRKKHKVHDIVESLSISKTKAAITQSHIVVLMTSATNSLENQDLAIAQLVMEAGKGLIILINKCDLVADFRELQSSIQYMVKTYLAQLPSVPVVYTSMVVKQINTTKILEEVVAVQQKWKQAISTGTLNRWLHDALIAYAPPKATNGKPLKLKYITQVRSKPPTFTIFANVPQDIPSQYIRYLTKSLARTFDLRGVPIRINFKQTDNPYV